MLKSSTIARIDPCQRRNDEAGPDPAAPQPAHIAAATSRIYAGLPASPKRPSRDQTVDQKQDHGDRGDADRADGRYRGLDRGAGDAGRDPDRGVRVQLRARLWGSGARQYPFARAGADDTPDRHRQAAVAGRQQPANGAARPLRIAWRTGRTGNPGRARLDPGADREGAGARRDIDAQPIREPDRCHQRGYPPPTRCGNQAPAGGAR